MTRLVAKRADALLRQAKQFVHEVERAFGVASLA